MWYRRTGIVHLVWLVRKTHSTLNIAVCIIMLAPHREKNILLMIEQGLFGGNSTPRVNKILNIRV